MAYWFSSKKVQLFCMGVSVTTIVTVLFILFMANWPSFARQKVVENVIFKNGTLGMQRFQNTSDLHNLRLSITVFSVTNVDEVIKSAAKMKLQEYGPYVYKEYKWKELVDNNQETGLITYKLRRRFVFSPELSVGDPKAQNITWLNVPVLSMISTINKMKGWKWLAAKTAVELMMRQVGETPFITDTVENFIFAGSFRNLFAELYKIKIIRDRIGPKWPLPDNKFAILYNRNNTWLPDLDHNFTVTAGFGPDQRPADLNQFRLMNGSAQLPYWKQDGQCNQLGGTDGQFFGPFLDYSRNLSVYSMDICRKLQLKFRQPTHIDGVLAYRYTLDEKSLQSAARNPENACYCLANDQEECKIDGLIDLSKCVADNVYASESHFLNGSPELSTRIAGMRPSNLTLDEPTIFIEPNTGFAIQVKVPIQFNVKLQRSDFDIVQFFNETKPLFVPLLTITEVAEMEDDQAAMLREKLLILDSWLISMVLGGAIILILVTVAAISIICMRIRRTRRVSSRPSERTPLLGEDDQN
uniref:Sensory neuron membrane protein 1 n=1 Tax=Aceria tosichella TaxID=561515 RepID=A0A6G1SDR2_9ACAR